MQTESELVQSNLANGSIALVKEHATHAIELLNWKDPVNNVAWKDGIAERNLRVANELITVVCSLDNMTMSSSSSEQQQSIPGGTNQLIGVIDAKIDEQ